MDTDSLRLFVAAAERLNISAAGRSLGLAPAMASARLAKLEHELGAELLHRTTRKVSLSQEGEAFLPYAREILAQSEAGRAALGLNAAEPSGTLRFAAPSSFAQLHIMPLLPAFHAKYPKITLDLRLSDTRFDLIEGSFDLALRSAPLESDSKLTAPSQSLARCRVTRLMCAMRIQASALAMDFSQSFDRRRHRFSQAKVRSTTHRRGSTSKPSAVSERLTIWTVHRPRAFSASRSLGPAYPPSANTCRNDG
ncbi:regulatory helix-turn-helix protein, lysR family [Loktanella salsilacus]|uniref:Regulatory helix-turn-helix protein, lysR family n=1 Tax=Loktanella salsilacus TaxID=195913 RepID=A0A1I4BKP4_9RHOB|nr:regulatory helix-turn-helix protein, lysR family [Loktanella salsilacus]